MRNTVKWYRSCFWIHSFSSPQTTEDYKHLPPSPNGQGHGVHSSSQNWLTQGHSWNMGGTCGRDLSYTKDAFKKGLSQGPTLWPAQSPASWTLVATIQGEEESCCLLWLRLCECMRMRNANWESTGGTGMCKCSAYHSEHFYCGT